MKVINHTAAFNAVQNVAKTVGLKLVPEVDCTQPRTDLVSGKVVVEPVNPYWSPDRLNKWRGEVYHEIGHHAPECIDILKLMQDKGLSFNSLFGKCINAVDDIRNEFNQFGIFAGRDAALSWTQGFYCLQGAMSLAKSGDSDLSTEMEFFRDLMGYIYQYRSSKQPDVAFSSLEFSKNSHPDRFNVDMALDAMTTAEDVYNIVISLFEGDDDMDAEEEEAKSKAAAEAEKAKEAEGEGEGESEGEDGEREEGEGDPADGEVSYKDLMGHTHSDDREDGGEFHTKINYDHDPEVYRPWNKMRIGYARDRSPDERIAGAIKDQYNEQGNIADAARRVFQSVTQTRVTHNHKSGRLDKRDLYRVPTGSVDVFRKKEAAPDPKGTALFVLVDASASMRGGKWRDAGVATALLNDAIQPLGVPTMIATFTEQSRLGCDHQIIKSFHENRNTDEVISDFGRIHDTMCQNADGESIMWAYNELLKRPEPRKVLLVLSDGSPCCDNWGDCDTYTRNVVAQLQDKIECYGIGIQSHAVERYYRDNVVLSRSSELGSAMLKVIRTKIFSL